MPNTFSRFYAFAITASQEYVLFEFHKGSLVGDAIVMISGEQQLPTDLAPSSRFSRTEFYGWLDQMKASGFDVTTNLSMKD